ncbi:hypothetical protein ACIREE_00575 [Streptomyces sp. NPDC102467]|uniref:hypothetical protein n=1 Tax=Streptomyces sp. NPDC102467 TaxID=3366179 RepID=UPI0038148A4D
MADEHDKWLDRDAAERLLRGESLEAVADDDIRRAGRLVAAFDALTALPAGPDGELPGEDGALKAFREARAVSAVDDAVDPSGSVADRAGRSAGPGRHRAGASGAPVPAEPGRAVVDGPRWGRPVRFAVAAALAACMAGGVAVAAGTGVLPSPFGGGGDPAPAASVSGAASPDRPLVSPSPGGTDRDTVLPDGSATPDGAGSPSAGNSGERPESKDSTRTPAPDATRRGSASEGMRRRMIEACLRYRGGDLGADERRRLRDSAKRYGRSTADIGRFCDRVLGRSGGSSDDSEFGFTGPDGSDGANGPGGPNGSDGRGDGQDGDEDDDAGNGGGSGNGGGGGGGENVGYHPIAPAPSPPPSPDLSYSASPELPTATATPTPSPSAS